jgi:hypothetical protein
MNILKKLFTRSDAKRHRSIREIQEENGIAVPPIVESTVHVNKTMTFNEWSEYHFNPNGTPKNN